jgi:HD superfamily phosphohydrolase
MQAKGKIFNDPIHGHIEISALAVKVMDTPQFQRLRDISQLGGTYFVFPGASSKRFEHSLGVSHLAKLFVGHLRANQPELLITDEEILCVEIAGLCHDLGHGPFSHLYDGKLLPMILKSRDFAHEHASIGILDVLIEENALLPVFKQHGLDEEDIHFIKELMLGDPHEAPNSFVWKGRPGRGFLYDIVANKRNGIDVDKFDYFARDCHMLGLTKSFDSTRLMKFARVFSVSRSGSSELEVCFHVKEAWNIFELFHTRYALHKRAYQHRVCNAVELMIVEALFLAEPFVVVAGKENIPRRLSECIHDFVAYAKLGEYIFKSIEHSSDPNMQPAQIIIQRLRKRDLFGFCGETILSNTMRSTLVNTPEPLETVILNQLQAKTNLNKQDIFVQIVHMGYGKGNGNPVSQVTTAFYEPIKTDEILDNSSTTARSHEAVDPAGVRWRIGGVPEGIPCPHNTIWL